MPEVSENPCLGESRMATIAGMARRKKTDNAEADTIPKTDAIRVDKDLAYKLAVIASIRRMSVAAIASPILRSAIEKMYGEALQEAEAQKR